MNKADYMILTNNPLVNDKLCGTHEVVFLQLSYEALLKEARNRIHAGHLLLSHPLSGSVKPNETPYKSVLISAERRETDQESVRLIENAILACQKFEFKSDRYSERVLEDFQLVDYSLIESGIASADAMHMVW